MLIKLKDYERIYKVINSIVRNEGADPSVCCIFFSAYGAYILSKHFKVNAYPRAGLAAYHLGGVGNALIFGEECEGGFTGENEAFHCWVEADGWAIDFMAPAFSLIDKKMAIPPKMFQKPLSEMAESPFDLAQSGDFYLSSTPEVTARKMSILSKSMAYSDLADICAQWFKKSPKKMHKSIPIADAKGNQNNVPLLGRSVIGRW